MDENAASRSEKRPRRRYTWPWLLLAAVVLGIVLSILWMRHEVNRIQRSRDSNTAPTESLK